VNKRKVAYFIEYKQWTLSHEARGKEFWMEVKRHTYRSHHYQYLKKKKYI